MEFDFQEKKIGHSIYKRTRITLLYDELVH